MNEVGMEIIIDAKMQGAIAGLNTVQKELAQTAVASVKVDSAFDKANSGIKKTGTNFTGLSRILQDLPFGFIGIQNNITQLLPAAGALGLAISAITSAITFSQVGFSAWTRGMNTAGKKAEDVKDVFREFADSQKDFTKSLQSAESSAVSTAVALRGFVEIAKNGQLPLEQRNIALQEANKILGDHAAKLSLVNISSAEATAEINKFTEALVQQALAAKFADRIADLIIQQKEAIRDYGKQLEATNKARQDFRNFKITGDEDILTLGKRLEQQIDTQNDKSKIYKQITAEISKLYGDLSEAQQGVTINTEKTLEKQKESKVTIKSILDDLNTTFDFINKKQDVFGGLLTPLNDKIKATRDAIDQLLKIGVSGDNPFVKSLLDGIDELQSQLPSRGVKLISGINAAFAKAKISIPAFPLIGLGDDANKGVEANRFKTLQDNIQKTADLLNTVLTPAFDAAFSAIEQGKNVFAAIGDSIKKVVLELIKAAIEAAIFSAIINIATGGGASLFSGFGKLFGSLSGLGNLFPHADGGIITKPLVAGSHLFGEAGKEAVIPLDRINEFLRPSSASDGLVMTHAIRGDDLLLILNRANRSAGRNK
jgi:hypothetical protein